MRQLILNDGSEVSLNPNVTALTMKVLRDKEDFKTSLMLNAMVKKEDISEFALMDATFLAYRQANPTGMKYEEFLGKLSLDFEELAPVFMEVIGGKKNTKFAQGFKKSTKAKKQQPKHQKSKSKR